MSPVFGNIENFFQSAHLEEVQRNEIGGISRTVRWS